MKDIRRARIYQIVNRVTGDHYIGSTKNRIGTRWNWHVGKLKNNIHELKEFQDAWNCSNIDEWDFRILEDNLLIEEQFEKELQWQDLLKPTFGSKTYFHRQANQEKTAEVLGLISDGKTYREISKLCDVSLGWITIIKERYIGPTPKNVFRNSCRSLKSLQKN